MRDDDAEFLVSELSASGIGNEIVTQVAIFSQMALGILGTKKELQLIASPQLPHSDVSPISAYKKLLESLIAYEKERQTAINKIATKNHIDGDLHHFASSIRQALENIKHDALVFAGTVKSEYPENENLCSRADCLGDFLDTPFRTFAVVPKAVHPASVSVG